MGGRALETFTPKIIVRTIGCAGGRFLYEKYTWKMGRKKMDEEKELWTINEQILKFAQNYPTISKTASSDAPFFMKV